MLEKNIINELNKFWDEKIDRIILPNGLTVILKEDHSAKLASVQLWVKTGSIHEGACLGSGLSHYLEHLMFKGTITRSCEKIMNDVQEGGGYFNAYTTFNRTVYYINTPSESIPIALDVLTDCIFHSTLPAHEVDKERGVIEREIDMGLDDPDHILSRGLYETAFRQHPYRYPVIGELSLFFKLNRNHLWNYYTTRYLTNNTVLVIVGDFETEALLELINALYEPIRPSSLNPVLIDIEPIQLATRTHRLEGDFQVERGNMAFKIPNLAHPDSPALDALSTVIGNGYSSILWQNLREKKALVHTINASCWNPGSVGLFSVYYMCDTGKALEVEAAVKDEIKRILEDGIDEATLQKVKRRALVDEFNVCKTMNGQASRLGAAEVVVGDLKYSQFYYEKLMKLTPSYLLQVAEKYLVEATLTKATLSEPSTAKVYKAKREVRKKVELPEFTLHTLGNGVRILLQPCEDSLPFVHIKVLSLGGPIFEDASTSGATALLGTLLTKDTQKRSAQQVAEVIENCGGNFSEMTGNNTIGLMLEVLKDDFELGLDILEQALLYPTFKENIFKRELKSQQAGVQEDLDDIVGHGFIKLRKHFFQENPFGQDPSGNLESLQGMNLNKIQDFYEKHFVGSNIVVSVSGSFKEKDVLERLKEVFSKIKIGNFKKNDFLIKNPAWLNNDQKLSESFVPQREYTLNMPREQAVVYIAFSDCGICSQDYYTAEVMHEIYSGMSSALFRKVRDEQSLAYYVGANRLIGLHMGMFYFYAGTQPGHELQVIQEIDKEVQRAREGGLLAEELKNAKIRLKAQKRSSLQTPASRALDAALNALYDLPINVWRQYDEFVEAVTLEDLQSFAERYFDLKKRMQLIVAPSKE